MKRWLILLLPAALLAAACVPPKQPPPPPPPGLDPPDSALPAGSPDVESTQVVGGLTNPWDISFLNDGTMFFDQRQGGVQVRNTNGTIANVANSPGDLNTGGGRGLMGLAVREPDATSTVPVYLCYSATSTQRVVRYDYNLLTGVTSPVVTNILAWPIGATAFNGDGPDHIGCRIRFGPDNLLYIGTGDGNIGTNPQDLNVLNGKVLRVNADGSPAAGNPFIGQDGDDHIYTYGHRNVQGLTWKGSQAYSVEHGSAIDDEVNKLVAGGNGGWNPVGEGGFWPGYDGHDTDPPMTDFNLPNCCMAPVWHSGEPTVAPSGATVVVNKAGVDWGSWNGNLIVAFLKDSQARVMVFDGSGGIATSSPFLSGHGRLRVAVQGPDGALYFSTDNGANDEIFKVAPPSASTAAAPASTAPSTTTTTTTTAPPSTTAPPPIDLPGTSLPLEQP
jgi:glucose/arabinose dehydrogenase